VVLAPSTLTERLKACGHTPDLCPEGAELAVVQLSTASGHEHLQ